MPTSATPVGRGWRTQPRQSIFILRSTSYTEASTKISLYKVQRLCLVIVHHLQLQHLQLQHLLLFSRTNTISLSTQHHIHNPIATINNMHGPFNGHGQHEKGHGLLGKVFNHHRWIGWVKGKGVVCSIYIIWYPGYCMLHGRIFTWFHENI